MPGAVQREPVCLLPQQPDTPTHPHTPLPAFSEQPFALQGLPPPQTLGSDVPWPGRKESPPAQLKEAGKPNRKRFAQHGSLVLRLCQEPGKMPRSPACPLPGCWALPSAASRNATRSLHMLMAEWTERVAATPFMPTLPSPRTGFSLGTPVPICPQEPQLFGGQGWGG